MKAKKLSTLLLTPVMAISLVACGGKDNVSDGNDIDTCINSDTAYTQSVSDILSGADTSSYEDFVKLLEDFYGYSLDDAMKEADTCGADWNQQALNCAIRELSLYHYGHDKLLDVLENNRKFTHEQAVYGLENCGANWDEEIKKMSEMYLKNGVSYDKLVSLLEKGGYSHDDAVNTVDSCGADWLEMAVKRAQNQCEYDGYSRQEVLDILETVDLFTHEQAVYGVDNSGLDWMEQAVKSGSSLMGIGKKRSELEEALIRHGFTPEEARHGAKNAKMPED